MQLQLVPASRGFAWMQQGIRTFGKRPVALLGLFMIFLLAMSILAMIPWIGLVLALALLPAVTLGFMSATRTVAHGDFPMPTVLLTAFRAGKEQLHGMLLLGGIYAMLFGASMALTQLIDGGQFIKLYLLGVSTSPEEIRQIAGDGSFQLATLVAAVSNVLIAMLFWHASALLHWHQVPAIKAMFFSLVACIRYHHDPLAAPEGHALAVSLVHVANSIAHLAEFDSRDLHDAPPIEPEILARLNLHNDQLMELVEQAQYQILAVEALRNPKLAE